MAPAAPLKAGKRTKQGARRLKKQRVQQQAAQPQKRLKHKTAAELDAEMEEYLASRAPMKVSESMA